MCLFYLYIYIHIYSTAQFGMLGCICRCKIDTIYHVSISNIRKAICRTKTYLKDQLNNVINLSKKYIYVS